MLGAVDEAMRKKGGRLLAISVDPPETSRALVEEYKLWFPILSDRERRAVQDYGLLHRRGGPEASDIAIPAHFLVDPDGRVRWRHVARRIQDRSDPAVDLEEIGRLP